MVSLADPPLRPDGLGRSADRPLVLERGLTLLEVLVAIGVIGLLVAIAAPSLRNAFSSARQTVSLSNARECAGLLLAYESEHRAFPSVVIGEQYRLGPNLVRGPGSVWETSTLWPALVLRDALPEHAKFLVSPASASTASQINNSGAFVPDYLYSHSFLANSALWSSTAATMPPAALERLVGPRNLAHVQHPTSKAIVWDRQRLHDQSNRAAVAFVDGHAGVYDLDAAAHGFPNQLNQGSETPLHNTPDGVRGRDF